MKNKSSRHKDANTFKFRPFSERISNIDVDIFHKVSHEYEVETEENESYLYQAIQKWDVLNLTEGYGRFKRDLKPENYITLPQVLLAKDNLIAVLLEHLKARDPLYLQAVLEVVVAVAKDLQKEFYPHYQQFLGVIIDLLNTKDTDQLEWTFTSLAHLFKILWRPMIKNINEVCQSLLPLLSDSKPEYVNAFAAESFAFVARKVKDKRAFLALLLKSIEKNKDGVTGCAQLLFEVIRGVDGQFHKCAEQFLPFYLDFLCKQPQLQSIFFEVFEVLVAYIAADIHPQRTKLFWDALFNSLSEIDVGNLELLLKLVGHMVEQKGGKLVIDSAPLILHLSRLLSVSDLPKSTSLVVIKIAILVLRSRVIRLPQEQASELIYKVLSLNEKENLLFFIEQVSECSLFETLILPAFLRKCGGYDFDNECLYTLTKLVVKKRPLCTSGTTLAQWTKYPLNLKEFRPVFLEKISTYLDLKSFNELQDKATHFCSLVCLPHVLLKPEQTEPITKQLVANLQFLLKEIEREQSKESIFWLNLVIECLIHLSATQQLEKQFGGVFKVLLKHTKGVEGLSALKTLSLMIAALPNCNKVEVLNQLNEVCEGNFSDPHHQVRLQTAFIYTQFEHLPEFQLKHSTNPEIPNQQFKVFSLIYQVEDMEPSVDTYRDQLRRLEKLNFDKPQMIMCNQTGNFKLIPTRYLCGVMYLNFKLLWEPTCKIIESHAHGLNISTFWSVFVEELKKAVIHVRTPPQQHLETLESDLEVLRTAFEDLQKVDDKPDFANYRQLLWKALVGFADVAEAKTRDVAQLMLSFVEDEYTNSNAEMATVANIKSFSHEAVNGAEPGNEEEEEEEEKYDSDKPGKVGRKVMIKTFLNKLAVFAQFKSPKSMYREPELYRLYFDLLKHKNADVQKAALDCLTTYKFKYLQPYKDRLYSLVDDKNFKHAITDFRIDKESAQVLGEHRHGLIPVVLQVVFSKMSSKTGLRTGGKASGQNRRNLILRFLAGCEEDEMLEFARKCFAIYEKYLQADEFEMVKTVSEVDLEKCLAPKKLLSTVNLLNVILDQFGGLMGEKLLTYLLRVLFVVGGVITGVCGQGDKVHSGYFAVLRTVRTSSIKTLERFFEQFDSYLWSCAQIEAVFHTFVWPYLGKLTVEGIHSPTSLLKLFKQWGSKPRYFKLLVKVSPNEQTILSQIFALLLGDKTHITVVNSIYDMVECLLKYEPSEEDNKLEIPVEGVENVELRQGLNFGSCILLPHVPKILTKIKQKLQNKNKTLNRTELFILCRISELVWESEVSGSVLELLIPVVLKKAPTADEEVMQQFLTTILNLLKNVANPQTHLRTFSPLFASVGQQSCRRLLVSIIQLMSKESNLLETVAQLVEELNSFDTKWLDKPDYERRHQAFKKIQELSLDVSCGALLIFNLFHMMKGEKDLALRDNSSHTLRSLCSALLQKTHTTQQDLDYLINGCIFSLIKTGLRCQNNQDYRNDCIALLGALARECPDSHFALRDLNKFTSQDQEVDCFENLTHLQMLRHSRAMIRFSKILREETVALNPKTVTQFLLPLASFYLCTEKFASKNAVVDAAIELVGVICQIVPWHQYEGILKYALSKLRYKPEFQKQLVRLVVVILDGFHFDLSKGHVTESGELKETEDTIPEVEYVEDVEGENEDVEEEEEQEVVAGKIVDKTVVLCKSTASRVIKTIQKVLLPQLHKTLVEFTNYDSSHKVNRKKTGFEREEEDLARVPISLAVVKLLQRLPKTILDSNLPRVFLKLCTFLKSHLESVRRVARETLQKIMLALGPKYLGMLLGQITPLMNRGYQVHVLVFTVHGVLSCLKGAYQPKDIDEILLTVLDLCTADLFGVLSEEKEVVKITVKVSEARSTKSYDTLHILAQHITEHCLMDLILPIKKFLETSHSFKTVQKVQDALKHIALGLVDNEFVQPESLLKFAYGTSAEKIRILLPSSTKKLTKKEKKRQQTQKENCLIIPEVPGNRSAYRELNVKTSTQTNAHLLVEFGLRLCFVLLKRDKIKDEQYRPFLDPFVTVFKKCLISKHVKLCSLTLQCLQWMMKYATPAMQQHIKAMAKDMFAILHKYAAAGLSKGDNFDLVVAAFKAVAVLVRDVQYYTLNTDQLKILLLYVEQDMHDHDRQATAFSLLKAIITRKLIVPEIHDVMTKVAELSVTSELSQVRAQARSVFHQFLMEYPLGNTLDKHVDFCISQLEYEMQYGRESAIEMIHSLINSFPLPVLKEYCGTLFVYVGERLVEEDVSECKEMVYAALTSMVKRLPKLEQDGLFEFITVWLKKDKNIHHRRLAAILCGIFVETEKEEFEARLPFLIPLLLKQFGLTNNSAGKYVRLDKPTNTPEELERPKDHHYFTVLQLIVDICEHCPAFLKKKKAVAKLAYHSQTLLGYEHEWVRVVAAQFLGLVLASIDVEELSTLLLLQKSKPGYLTVDPEKCLKSLTEDLFDQMQPGVRSELVEAASKNLVILARALRKVPTTETKRINLFWLTIHMRRIVNWEVNDNIANTLLRTEVFKWIAGVVTVIDADAFRPVIPHLLAPLVREMVTTDEKNAPLRQLATEVAHRLKEKIGLDEYTETLQKVQRNLNVKRAERKRVRTQLAVTNPEVHAQKKIKLHEKKKIAKKRKLEEVRGKKTFKRKKVADVEDNSDVV